MTARPIIAVHPSFSAAKGAVSTAVTIKSGKVPVFPRHSLSVKNFLHAQRRKNHDKKLLHDFYVENVPAWHEAGSSFIKRNVPVHEAILMAVKTVEDDPAISSVGYGGLPNAKR